MQAKTMSILIARSWVFLIFHHAEHDAKIWDTSFDLQSVSQSRFYVKLVQWNIVAQEFSMYPEVILSASSRILLHKGNMLGWQSHLPCIFLAMTKNLQRDC